MISFNYFLTSALFLFTFIQNNIALYNSVSSFFTNLKKRLNTHSQEQVLQIGFLHGSRIENEFYSSFLNTLEQTTNPNIKLNVTYLTYNPMQKLANNTILIGHSFGGYIGLLYCIKENMMKSSNVKACVLINSHFNERYKMPYFTVSLSEIKYPVLVLLNRNDEKLPIEKAIDDYEVSRINKDNSKRFRIGNGNHTSIFVEEKEMEWASHQIHTFLRDYNLS